VLSTLNPKIDFDMRSGLFSNHFTTNLLLSFRRNMF